MTAEGVVKIDGKPLDMGRHTLIFTHIPKCGGTSLHRTFSDIFADRYRHFTGDPAQRNGVDCLLAAGGHQQFGHNPLHQRKSGLVYVTLIRDPVDRFLSFYRHVQDHPEHHLHAKYPALASLSPLGFAMFLHDAGEHEISDLQAKMLAPGIQSAEAAIDHIATNYSVVGSVDAYGDFMREISRMFPLSRITEFRLNRGDGSAVEIDADLREFIEEINDLDVAIYRHFRKSRGWAAIKHRATRPARLPAA